MCFFSVKFVSVNHCLSCCQQHSYYFWGLVLSCVSCPLRDGVPFHSFPKSRHCLDGGGLTLAWIFFKDFPHALRALKSDISPQKCSLFPRKYHSPHLFNIFTLKHDLRTFVEKMLQDAFTHFYGPNRSGCLDWGVGRGGQPNSGIACILGTFGHDTPPF